MASLVLLVAVGLGASQPAGLVADGSPIHLGLSLEVTHVAALAAAQRAIQDPASPAYHRWFTPETYGDAFGQPPAVYADVVAWLSAAGLEVKTFPSRTFLEASGTAGQVTRLLGIQLRHVAGERPGVHVPVGAPRLPPSLAKVILQIAGLDTRVVQKHRLAESGGAPPALGPQDVRRFYDLAPILDGGYVGQGQKLAVLAWAEPPASVISPEAIGYYLQNVSDARVKLIYDVLPNPQMDIDPGGGGNQEFQPDVELQSIGAPGAESITLVLSPASEVFSTGASEIVNHLSTTTSVSISLGSCEKANPSAAITTLQQLVIQGTLEGQTWSASSGDFGADDCGDGFTQAVDFPASLPEIVALGGTQIDAPAFDANQALPAYQAEVVWNVPQRGAAGGGFSSVFSPPSYQGFAQGLLGRSVPDLSLLAGNPGVAADSSNPFVGLPIAAQLTAFEGTSASSPLSAGFFALIASRVGCRLGDPHAALYALGLAQFDGGPSVFHDITSGTVAFNGVAGPSATTGFDSASGWGTLDVAAVAAAWPPCPLPDAGYGFDAGREASYAPCAFIACDAGTCTTLPEGPSSCAPACGGPSDAGCGPDTLCFAGTLFSDAGVCVPGCTKNTDCTGDAGQVCNLCEETCILPGTPDAGVGQACVGPLECLTGSLCLTQDMFGNTFPSGYCTTY